MKAYKGREKGLLRKAMEGYLPDEIIYRKKSPYPKTYNPSYTQKVKEELTKKREIKQLTYGQDTHIEIDTKVTDDIYNHQQQT